MLLAPLLDAALESQVLSGTFDLFSTMNSEGTTSTEAFIDIVTFRNS